MKWLRLYAETVDDPKLRLLAFEDRWHFIAVLCMKAQGMFDSPTAPELRERMVAVKLGLQGRDADEVKRRLLALSLIDEQWEPVHWNSRQFDSDSSLERVRKYRENKRKNQSNADVTLQKRYCNGTDTDTDTERDKTKSTEPFVEPNGSVAAAISIPLNTGQAWAVSPELLDEWISLYPGTDVLQELRKMRAWCDAKPTHRKTARGVHAFVVHWLNRAHDTRRQDGSRETGRRLSAVEIVREANDARERERERTAT